MATSYSDKKSIFDRDRKSMLNTIGMNLLSPIKKMKYELDPSFPNDVEMGQFLMNLNSNCILEFAKDVRKDNNNLLLGY